MQVVLIVTSRTSCSKTPYAGNVIKKDCRIRLKYNSPSTEQIFTIIIQFQHVYKIPRSQVPQ